VESSCERGNEASGYIKCWETTEHSAPQLVTTEEECANKTDGKVKGEKCWKEGNVQTE
jgi:hypothetical protein